VLPFVPAHRKGRVLVDLYLRLYQLVGPLLLVAISIIAIRMLSYWHSLAFHWRRYRRRDDVTVDQLRALDVPVVKIQITTRGADGSTEVILRGIRNVAALIDEDPAYLGPRVAVEVITESPDQAAVLAGAFVHHPLDLSVLVLPSGYETAGGTRLKARALQFVVEMRRAGWNRRDGRTFIVHFDEESVMVPAELRKLLAHLATTDRKVMEGPIYYPLEYLAASSLCRAMEANRPVGCFECRHVMETGVPLHLHGSNLVIEEAFENAIGWDIGSLDGQALIAEDYVFGMNAFLAAGPDAFGWHGCVLLEQPPFSVKSAFKQRHRWVFGVLQGLALAQRHPGFTQLAGRMRRRLLWGTRFRVATFALGALVGGLALLFLPLVIARSVAAVLGAGPPPLSPLVMLWMAVVGACWLGSVFVGAWYNVLDAGLSRTGRRTEIARAVALAPVAGILESTAALWAVVEWCLGRRAVSWQPTPKTKAADAALDWSVNV
jgi:hypothetical protein